MSKITHAELIQLVDSGAIRKIIAVGRSGGWSLSVRTDRLGEQVLVTQGSGRLRGFHNLDAVIAYLQAIGVSWFNVDTTGLPVVPRCPELLSPIHVHMDMDIKIWTPERLLTIVYTPDQQAAIDEAIAIALSSVDRWGDRYAWSDSLRKYGSKGTQAIFGDKACVVNQSRIHKDNSRSIFIPVVVDGRMFGKSEQDADNAGFYGNFKIMYLQVTNRYQKNNDHPKWGVCYLAWDGWIPNYS
jgi:hypothetical protein